MGNDERCQRGQRTADRSVKKRVKVGGYGLQEKR